ncbi:uncharacterized protein LOC135198673 isoform X1 [Macrobrachium nipponense]|uniref:uncharacterized protein LOC135198673 isoform X1 n=1 Tax=Macrobrachium nipponense TaxID=159736 RepID=UPI0030C7E132
MEWKREEVRCLINAYRHQPCLWNVKLQEYKSRYARDAAMRKLVEVMLVINEEITEEDIKKKIHTLRGQYKREQKTKRESTKSGAGTDDDVVYIPKLWCYDLLHFLQDDNVRESTSSLEMIEGEEKEEEEVGGGDCPTGGATIRPLETILTTSPQPSKKLRVHRTSENVPDPPSTRKPPPEISDNSYEDFGRYVAARLEDIEKKSPETCSVVRKLINDAIFEGEMGTLRGTSRIVTPSDGHFIMQIPAPLQCPVAAAPEVVQCPVAAPEKAQRPVTAPEKVQCSVTTPEKV